MFEKMILLKSAFLIAVSVFLNLNIYSQSTSAKKFENAVEYLMTNKEKLASVWLSLVNDNSAKGVDYKKIIGSRMEFFISDTLSPRGLLPFIDSLKKDKSIIGLTESGIDSLIALNEQSGFEPYSDSLLKSIIGTGKLNQHKYFKIAFSEPFKNTVRAELWYTYFGNGYRTRFGDSLMILFWFNADSTIRKVYFIRAIK